ncbi:MAG: LysM peptidoglycan-binding domain-containing M23 family metallopeptidase [Candidatus Omnitrophota bacterium]
MKKFLLVSLCLCFLMSFSGCATTPSVKAPQAPVVAGMPGVYHRVERGQTLWRISKMYNVELDEVARINRITDTTSIEVGQQIFIPNRQKPQSLTPGYFSDDFIWPLKGKIVSLFGQTFNNMINKGINIEPQSATSVVAARSGKVVFYAESFGSYGKTLIIEHGDGFSTVYARNAEILVRPGDMVQRGAPIAKVGSAGRDKNRYLHFEIRKGHIPQNPYFYLTR